MRALVPADLIKFFSALARRVPCPVKLTLTGGSEAMLLGGTRPTGDLDFELALPPGCARLWRAVEEAVAAAAAETAVTVQYSADIDRWSSIAVPTAKRRTRLRRRVGRVAVHLLEPRCWAVYKLARYLDADVEEGAVTRVLPARPHVVHHVAERQVGLGIAEPERAAGAEVPERAGVRSERALRLRQLEAEREAGGALEHPVGAVRVLGDPDRAEVDERLPAPRAAAPRVRPATPEVDDDPAGDRDRDGRPHLAPLDEVGRDGVPDGGEPAIAEALDGRWLTARDVHRRLTVRGAGGSACPPGSTPRGRRSCTPCGRSSRRPPA